MELGTWVAPAWKWQLQPWGHYKPEDSKVLWINPPSHRVGILPATWPKTGSVSSSWTPPLDPLITAPAPKGSSSQKLGDIHALPPLPTSRWH